jgi:hypothetical protein
MVTEVTRVEAAARIAMAHFEGPAAIADPRKPTSFLFISVCVGLALTAAALFAYLQA